MFCLKNGAGSLANLWYGEFSIFPKTMVTAAVSARQGGVSEGVYRSLNLALHVGDRPEAVIENRRRFLSALELDFDKLVTAQQTHSDRVAVVTASDAGRGNRVYADALDNTDAMVTNVPGLPLMVFVADCTPVLLFDPVKRAVGAVHAGWRGSYDSIAAQAVETMTAAYGSRPEDILASVGPSINGADYEVGSELADMFTARFGEAVTRERGFVLTEGYEKEHLDLWAVNQYVLEQAGVPPENICNANVSTDSNHELFFSFRHDKGATGRLAAVIALK